MCLLGDMLCICVIIVNILYVDVLCCVGVMLMCACVVNVVCVLFCYE